MYGVMVNRIPHELSRIAEAINVPKVALAFRYLNYIFETYLDEGARQFSIYDFLHTESGYDQAPFEDILRTLEIEIEAPENVKSIITKVGGGKQSALYPYYQELFQSGLRAMLMSLNGLHDVLQLSMESLKIKFRMYQNYFIVEYDTTGVIFDDHDEVIDVAIKSLSELEYF